jgi:hypothetical protein
MLFKIKGKYTDIYISEIGVRIPIGTPTILTAVFVVFFCPSHCYINGSYRHFLYKFS